MKHKFIVLATCSCFTITLFGGCSVFNSAPKEEQIKEDISALDEYEGFEIKNVEIKLSDTSGKKSANYEVEVCAENDWIRSTKDLKLYYSKYDQGWVLNDSREDKDATKYEMISEISNDMLPEYLSHITKHSHTNVERFKNVESKTDLDSQTVDVTFDYCSEDGKYGDYVTTYSSELQYDNGEFKCESEEVVNKMFVVDTDSITGKLVTSYDAVRVDALPNATITSANYNAKNNTLKLDIDYHSRTTETSVARKATYNEKTLTFDAPLTKNSYLIVAEYGMWIVPQGYYDNHFN